MRLVLMYNPVVSIKCVSCGIITTRRYTGCSFGIKQMREEKDTKCPVCKSNTRLISISGTKIESWFD